MTAQPSEHADAANDASEPDAIALPILQEPVESCEGCGACCLQTAVPPYVLIDGVHEASVRGVPADLLASIFPAWQVRFSYPEQPCLWYDAEHQRCQHYEHRPQACRDFERNSYACHAIRDRWGIASAAAVSPDTH